MPTPESWYLEGQRILKREQRHPCGCTECSCDQTVKAADICPSCRDGYHLVEPDEAA